MEMRCEIWEYEVPYGPFKTTLLIVGGPGSIVGIVTGYGLDGPGIESRWRARFSAPV